MPTFEFECSKCGDTRTETISIHVNDFQAICKCGTRMSKVYGRIGVQFKGSGFYATDKGDNSGDGKDN